MISALFCVVNLLTASPCLDTDFVPGMQLVQPNQEVVIQRPVGLAQPQLILARRGSSPEEELAKAKVP